MIIVKCLRECCKKFENKHSVSLKSWGRFLHLSSFSDSNSCMTAGPGFYAAKNHLKWTMIRPCFELLNIFCSNSFSGSTHHQHWNTQSVPDWNYRQICGISTWFFQACDGSVWRDCCDCDVCVKHSFHGGRGPRCGSRAAHRVTFMEDNKNSERWVVV